MKVCDSLNGGSVPANEVARLRENLIPEDCQGKKQLYAPYRTCLMFKSLAQRSISLSLMSGPSVVIEMGLSLGSVS